MYTTNYDTILDDILNDSQRYPYHLHGSFSINHLNKDPDGRYGPKEAKLIWGGINAESKYEELRPGLDYNTIDFSHFRYGKSRIADYFEYLEEKSYEEIHILGYSGENDEHINKRLRDNKLLKNIIVYVNPSRINDREEIIKSRMLYQGNNASVIRRPWNDFWKDVQI